MATYSSSSPTYATGGSGVSPEWQTPNDFPPAASFGLDFSKIGWLRFTGATLPLANNIISATLTIHGYQQVNSEDVSETCFVEGDLTEDGELPADLTEAGGRPLTTADDFVYPVPYSDVPFDLVIDITDVIAELVVFIDGDVILLKISNPTYSGSGSYDMTASLVIEYSIGDGGGGGEGEGGALSGNSGILDLYTGDNDWE